MFMFTPSIKSRKFIFTSLIVLLVFKANAQEQQLPQKTRFTNGLAIPVADSSNFSDAADSAVIFLQPSDSAFYYKFNGYFKKLVTLTDLQSYAPSLQKITDAGSITTNDITGKVLNANEYVTSILMRLKSQTGYSVDISADSLSANRTISFPDRSGRLLVDFDTLLLSSRINEKLGKTDTFSLSGRINDKLNSTDTATLSNRINEKLSSTDTLNLSSRINDKLNNNDTLSLSYRIDQKLGRSSPGVSFADKESTLALNNLDFENPALKILTKAPIDETGLNQRHLYVSLDSLAQTYTGDSSRYGNFSFRSIMFKDMNNALDPTSKGNLVSLLGWNLEEDNLKRNKMWLQYEQEFNQPNSPFANKRASEFHISVKDTLQRETRVLTAFNTYDGSFAATTLNGDIIKLGNRLNSDNSSVEFNFQEKKIFLRDSFYFINDHFTGLPFAKQRNYNNNQWVNLIMLNKDETITIGDLRTQAGIRVDKVVMPNINGEKLILVDDGTNIIGQTTTPNSVEFHVTPDNHFRFIDGGRNNNGNVLFDLVKDRSALNTKLLINKNTFGTNDALEVGGSVWASEELKIGSNILSIHQSPLNPFAVGMDRMAVEGLSGFGISPATGQRIRILGTSNSSSSYSIMSYSNNGNTTFSVRDDKQVFASRLTSDPPSANGAGEWKFGKKVDGGIQVSVDGTLYTLLTNADTTTNVKMAKRVFDSNLDGASDKNSEINKQEKIAVKDSAETITSDKQVKLEVVKPNETYYWQAAENSDGRSLHYYIPHYLGVRPMWWNAVATSVDAGNILYISADEKNIIIHYKVPPSSGINNLSWNLEIRTPSPFL